jgi:hypothetical protein
VLRAGKLGKHRASALCIASRLPGFLNTKNAKSLRAQREAGSVEIGGSRFDFNQPTIPSYFFFLVRFVSFVFNQLWFYRFP